MTRLVFVSLLLLAMVSATRLVDVLRSGYFTLPYPMRYFSGVAVLIIVFFLSSGALVDGVLAIGR